jgi:hypothetical protein
MKTRTWSKAFVAATVVCEPVAKVTCNPETGTDDGSYRLITGRMPFGREPKQ